MRLLPVEPLHLMAKYTLEAYENVEVTMDPPYEVYNSIRTLIVARHKDVTCSYGIDWMLFSYHV